MQSRTANFPAPAYLRSMSNDNVDDRREVRITLRRMSKTLKEVLLAGDDKIRSMGLSIEGREGTQISLIVHGKMTGTSWKTTITLSRVGDMISFEVKLPRGRHSYRTDILAKFVNEEVVREYAEHALVQLLKKEQSGRRSDSNSETIRGNIFL